MRCHGGGGTSSDCLNFCTRWRRVLSFIPRPLYSQGQTCVPTASLCSVKKWSSPGIEPRFLSCPTVAQSSHCFLLVCRGLIPCYRVNWLKVKRFWFVLGRCWVRISAGRLTILRVFREFAQSTRQVPGYSLKLCRNRFLLHRFQFFIHW
jgi:hypothetical protein